jgi:hypothetical protein
MRVTFATEIGDSYTVEIDPQMELENIMALLEAEVHKQLFFLLWSLTRASPESPSAISAFPSKAETSITPKALCRNTVSRMTQCFYSERRSSLQEGVLFLHECGFRFAHYHVRTGEQDAEMMRLMVLGDPDLMRQLRTVRMHGSCADQPLTIDQHQPEVAEAAQHNPSRFAELLRQLRPRHQQIEEQRLQDMAELDADPYNVDAQRRIEERIRQAAVLENMEQAIEHSPEAFGKVTML